MGVVYAAHDPRLGRDVALKLLGGGGIGTEARARLTREARAMARLSHPHVVQVYDAGTWEDDAGPPRVFIAMELVAGEDMAAKLRALHTTERWASGAACAELVGLFADAGEGLAAAHAVGLVHRDFKPANILVDEGGRVRVGDFGLSRGEVDDDAHDLASALRSEVAATPSDADGTMTRTGDVLGTPGYIAPELFLGQSADARSDQWAFCVSLWEALHGRRPIRAASFPELALATIEGRIEDPPPKPPVPRHIDAILRRGLHVNPAQRFGSMDELTRALRAALARPRRARRRAALGAALVAAVGVGVALVSFTASPSAPCLDASRPVAEAWSPQTRTEVDRHVRSLPVPFAGRLAEDAVASLDRYATELTSSYRDACEATFVRETQSRALLDRRTACLDRRRAELRAFARELATGDVHAVERATRAVQLHPTFAACEDTGALLAGVDPPPVGLHDAVTAARESIAGVRAKIAAGDLDGALSRGRAVREETGALAYRPVQLDAELAYGLALAEIGQFTEASEALRAVLYGALATGDLEQRLEATTALVDVDGVRRMRLDVGDVWADIATSTLERFDEDRPIARARLENALAQLRGVQGRRDEALAHAARAVELVVVARGADDLALLGPLRELGDVRVRLRDFAGALEPLERAATLAAELPETHPARLAIEARRAGALVGLGRAEEAVESMEATRDRAVANLPEAHPVRAFVLLRTADALAHVGRLEDAISVYRDALDVTVAAYGAEHTEVARVSLNLAGAEARAGRTDEAIAAWKDALAMRERLLGDAHPDLAIILQNIGSAETERGRAREALAPLARGWQIRHESPASRAARADLDYWYGRALVESGEDPPRGRALVTRAERTAREEGYARSADEMRAWLDAHP